MAPQERRPPDCVDFRVGSRIRQNLDAARKAMFNALPPKSYDVRLRLETLNLNWDEATSVKSSPIPVVRSSNLL